MTIGAVFACGFGVDPGRLNKDSASMEGIPLRLIRLRPGQGLVSLQF
jgi:hypothetical protein